MHFVIDGPLKPYVRMTRRGKWVSRQAQEYLASKERLAVAFQAQMAGRWMHIERGTPLEVTILISHGRGFHNRDLDNEVKAVLDAMQNVVFDDDRWVDRITASRWRGPRDRLTVVVKPITEENGCIHS